MKKFIILLISLFLGVFISNNIHVDKKVKNDITVVAPCTDNNVILATNVDNVHSVYTINEANIHYYINSQYNNQTNSNNHSIKNNTIILYKDMIMSYIYNYIKFPYKSTQILYNAKTVGLQGIGRIYTNIYLYHAINKLGQT